MLGIKYNVNVGMNIELYLTSPLPPSPHHHQQIKTDQYIHVQKVGKSIRTLPIFPIFFI